MAESLVAELADGHELPGGFDEQLLDAMLGALIAGKRGEREDLLVQSGQAPLALLDQLRLKVAVAIPRRVDRHRA